ncbi:MAG: 16S rRNA processing protein RimM [Lachnospiraceae bacterium]|nr:16S rRNA processing protein RimM [Lachnospiraceae bacterium]
MSGMFRIGVVTTTHGVKGAVKVYPTTDDPRRFLDLKTLLYGQTDREEDASRKYEIEKVQFFKNQVILKLKGVEDMDAALLLKGGSLWIPDEDAVKLQENEFFIRDFLGARVLEETDAEIGTIYDIMETGSNFVFEIREESGKSFLLPVIRDCVLHMDRENSTVTVHVLEGLRE